MAVTISIKLPLAPYNYNFTTPAEVIAWLINSGASDCGLELRAEAVSSYDVELVASDEEIEP